MRGGADENLVNDRILGLCMASQAKIWVVHGKHFAVDRAMRVVTSGATFAHGFVLENDRPRLLAMTLGAAFIEPRHRESSRWLENVAAVRVVALHAVHVAFDDGMMLRQIEFSLSFEVALKTRRRVFVRIDDELAAAADFDVFAARAVTGFAAGLAFHAGNFKMHPRVRAAREHAHVFRMAIQAGLVPDIGGAGNFRRRHDGALKGGT